MKKLLLIPTLLLSFAFVSFSGLIAMNNMGNMSDDDKINSEISKIDKEINTIDQEIKDLEASCKNKPWLQRLSCQDFRDFKVTPLREKLLALDAKKHELLAQKQKASVPIKK